jgi:hypothetical protein
MRGIGVMRGAGRCVVSVLAVGIFAFGAAAQSSKTASNASGATSGATGSASAPAANAAERTFHKPADQVRKALQGLHGTESGRLPTLEGFVDEQSAGGVALEHYQRGFYQCVVQVTPSAKGATVRVTAKITAWYADPAGAHSGYKSLESNGRLEADFLDQMEEALGVTAASGEAGAAAGTANAVNAAPTAGSNRAKSGAGSTKATSGKSPAAATTPSEAASASNSANATLDLATLQKRREAAERQMQELSANLRTLQEIQQNQAHPNDLAAVRKGDTPVYAKPDAGSEELMRAHEQDEFQVLGVDAQWVHVQISGASRGWIKRSQVEVPPSFEPTTKPVSTSPLPLEPFRVNREETGTFPGDWKPLAGKTVRIVWVTPTGSSSAGEKRAYAKSILLARAESAADAAGISGVVVIFDSADGGQVAATLVDIRKLSGGALQEDDFWRACSLDPPESFTQTSPTSMDR